MRVNHEIESVSEEFGTKSRVSNEITFKYFNTSSQVALKVFKTSFYSVAK
jgi:hypothetical protein